MWKKLWKNRIYLFLIILILFLLVGYVCYQDRDTFLKQENGNVETHFKDKTSEIDTNSDKVEKLRREYQNDDIIGNLSIAGTGIDEAILQSGDNDYYLNHDNYGNYDKYGSIFLDYRCHKNSKKLLIFGHSSIRIDTPFNNLEKYYEEDYYKNHLYIDVVIDDEVRKYLIFSVYIETSDFTYMNLNISDEVYLENLKDYKKKSFYDTGVDVYPSDEILILQTCSNHKDYVKYKDKYLLIIAKKI